MSNALIDRFGILDVMEEKPVQANPDMKCECGGEVSLTIDLKLKISIGDNGMPSSNGCLKFTCLSCQEVRYIPLWRRDQSNQMIRFKHDNVSY